MTSDMLIWSYCRGIFPMADSRRGKINWYSPDPRAVLPLESFHASHSLRRRVRNGPYRVTIDAAFEPVVGACVQPRPGAAQTWINREIRAAYAALHEADLAHSVEAWHDIPGQSPSLAGGLYGVSLGGAFFGESMFSRKTDASKVCLVHLVAHLRNRGFTLLDTQFATPHLAQFGVIEIPRRDYLHRLDQALRRNVVF